MNDNLPIQPVQCAPWCRYRNGHTDALMAADQVCYSEPVATELSISQPTAGRGWSSPNRAFVSLSLHHDVPDARPVLDINLNDDSGILFTLEEAERFAWRILHVAETARIGLDRG